MYYDRPHVEDIRAMKKRGEKISMPFVTTREEAAAAAEARVHMSSIEGRFFDAEMREAGQYRKPRCAKVCRHVAPELKRLATRTAGRGTALRAADRRGASATVPAGDGSSVLAVPGVARQRADNDNSISLLQGKYAC